MDEEMNILVQFRGRLKGSITLALVYAENPPDDCTLELVGTRLERLNEVWSEFVSSAKDMDMFRNCAEYTDPDVDFGTYEEKFLSARGRLHTLKQNLTPLNENHNHEEAISRLADQQATFLQQLSKNPSSGTTYIRNDLPSINIQPFTGFYKDWPSFKDLFVSSIDSKPGLSNTQKFHYLKSLLRNDAANLIRHIPITDAAYTTAWIRLNDRFDRPRQIVNSFIESFINLPATSTENVATLRTISDGANEVVRGMEAIDHSERDCWLIYLLLEKLDMVTRRKWIEDSRCNPMPTIADFLQFLDSRCEEMELAQCETSRSKCANVKQNNSARSLLASESSAQKCLKCNVSDHTIAKCPRFLALSIDNRRSFVKEKSMCFNCLKTGHTSYSCNSKFRCRECHKRHHTLVHSSLVSSLTPPQLSTPDNTVTSSKVAPPGTPWSTTAHIVRPVFSCTSSQLENSQAEATLISQRRSTFILPTARVNVRNVQGGYITCRVLLDSASELSYITESCVQALGLPRSHSRVTVSGISSVKAESTRGRCALHIQSKTNEHTLNVCTHILSNITSPLPSSTINISTTQQLQNLPLADPLYNVSSPIDILLGTQDIWNVFTLNRIFDSYGNTIAVSSIFGWVVTAIPLIERQNALSFLAIPDIDRSLRRFWEIEEPSSPTITDPDNDVVEQHFVRTHTRHIDGKYIVHLPFKEQDVRFGDTFKGALSRFTSVERRLRKDANLHKQYTAFIREYIQLSHMRELYPHEIEVADGKVFYMPHHPVLGEKLRVVFDGSFTDEFGRSLNSCLHIGPSIQRNLFAVCLRFRLHRVVFAADIVKMFRQIWVTESQRNYQRIIWRENPGDPIKHFQLCTVTYGTSCAPFLSVRVLEQLANDYRDTYPLASRILHDDFYVDDVLTGASTEEELLEIRNQLIALLSAGGLELRKWVSNCEGVIANMHEDQDEGFLKSTGGNITKVLGLHWKPYQDVLAYNISLETKPNITKRQVLSDVSSIFDPLGLLAPVVIQFKILFQELWLYNLNWDDVLPEKLAQWWIKIRSDVSNIKHLSIPRFVENSTTSIELHGFSDASTKAYAAVVYCRAKDVNGIIHVSPIGAKTRVAPLKQISLPRMELCGALLLTRLIASIKQSLTHTSITVNAWCDSTVVLSWLSHPPAKLKTFIANRTAEILDTLPRNVWHHVISKENPADCASRGMMAAELLNFNLWWKGPQWLAKEEEYQNMLIAGNKFNSTVNSEAILEIKASTINLLTTEEVSTNPLSSLVERSSSWRKCIRILAYIQRFISKIRPHSQQLAMGGLRFDELKSARIALLRHAQSCFNDEKEHLVNNAEVLDKSKLIKLNPFVDETGLIRVGGRLRHSQLDENIQHPIILPKEHRLTYLILLDEHERNLHPGVSALFVILRQTYWVLGGRNLIRTLTHKCLRCFRQRQISTHQLMADLPAVRVRQAFPFEKTGCDYAGPFTLKLYAGRNARTSKGYICLFVCLVTSAIHMELATDLSTECFLAALRRFMSRRGKCSQIFSDNGRNFLGASRSLNDMHKVITSQTHNELVSASLAEDGIRWSYIPPHAPHWGGIWESAIRSVKLHIRRVIGKSLLTFEQMRTLLAQIEAVVNSRPLGAAADSETNYLSPSHFLIGRPYTMIPEGDLSNVNSSRLDYWQHVQNMYQGFWRRWHQEYLTSLQQRPKWSSRQANVAIDNLVVIKEPTTAPSKWLIAKVIEVYPGNDGLVRVVKLRTAYGEMTRPITKIVVLPVF